MYGVILVNSYHIELVSLSKIKRRTQVSKWNQLFEKMFLRGFWRLLCALIWIPQVKLSNFFSNADHLWNIQLPNSWNHINSIGHDHVQFTVLMSMLSLSLQWLLMLIVVERISQHSQSLWITSGLLFVCAISFIVIWIIWVTPDGFPWIGALCLKNHLHATSHMSIIFSFFFPFDTIQSVGLTYNVMRSVLNLNRFSSSNL